jgi:hypothetical protein
VCESVVSVGNFMCVCECGEFRNLLLVIVWLFFGTLCVGVWLLFGIMCERECG